MATEIKSRAKGWTVHSVETNPLRHFTREQLYNLLGTHIPHQD